MSETTTLHDPSWASIELDEELYPRDAVQGAAYVFLERSYLFLERLGDNRLLVRLKARTGDSAALAGEFENEALAQAYRRRIASSNRALIESITARAIAGAAGPPGLDDLLAMDIGSETAFDDPLGIAMSWEEKYTKKKADKASPEPSPEPQAPSDQATDRDDQATDQGGLGGASGPPHREEKKSG
jgi:His-Xaa-Ser system protein HxsD